MGKSLNTAVLNAKEDAALYSSAAAKSLSDIMAEDDDKYRQQPGQAYLDHLLDGGSREGDSGTKCEMPPWYDDSLFRKGQTYMSKYRFVLTSGMLSGLVAVLAIPSILKVLVCSGQSSTARDAYRRYIRTIFHTMTWYQTSPDDPKFWNSIRAVRYAHTQSSQLCSRRGAGKITQKDMALTQFGFIGFITLGAHRIQMNDPEFHEATAHMWRVIGYLLGIKDEYNVCGRNWAESKQRLEIVMRQVYAPALQQTDDTFMQMTKALIDGLWPLNTTLSVGSFLFFTKRLAYVKGYEYYEFDYAPWEEPQPQKKLHYYDMGLLDRLTVAYGLFLVTYLHKYDVVRVYLNFRVWLSELFMYYLPYLAIWKYGLKHSYVRIFKADGSSQNFEFHLKEE